MKRKRSCDVDHSYLGCLECDLDLLIFYHHKCHRLLEKTRKMFSKLLKVKNYFLSLRPLFKNRFQKSLVVHLAANPVVKKSIKVEVYSNFFFSLFD